MSNDIIKTCIGQVLDDFNTIYDIYASISDNVNEIIKILTEDIQEDINDYFEKIRKIILGGQKTNLRMGDYALLLKTKNIEIMNQHFKTSIKLPYINILSYIQETNNNGSLLYYTNNPSEIEYSKNIKSLSGLYPVWIYLYKTKSVVDYTKLLLDIDSVSFDDLYSYRYTSNKTIRSDNKKTIKANVIIFDNGDDSKIYRCWDNDKTLDDMNLLYNDIQIFMNMLLQVKKSMNKLL